MNRRSVESDLPRWAAAYLGTRDTDRIALASELCRRAVALHEHRDTDAPTMGQRREQLKAVADALATIENETAQWGRSARGEPATMRGPLWLQVGQHMRIEPSETILPAWGPVMFGHTTTDAIERDARTWPDFMPAVLSAIQRAVKSTQAEYTAVPTKKSVAPRDTLIRDLGVIFHACHAWELTKRDGRRDARGAFVAEILAENGELMTAKAVEKRMRKPLFALGGRGAMPFGPVPPAMKYDAGDVLEAIRGRLPDGAIDCLGEQRRRHEVLRPLADALGPASGLIWAQF